MSIEKPAAGTRGGKPAPKFVAKFVMPMMMKIHRRTGDKFSGMNLLYLTTIGARSGETRCAPVARMDDGKGGWLIVASAGGGAQHPGWYHNIAAHPDQVWAEAEGAKQRVQVTQLEGDERAFAWSKVVEQVPRFKGYLDKTDREMPILRLTPTP